MLRIKVTYIVSNIDKALAFEWLAEKLDRSRFDLNFIFLNSSDSKTVDRIREFGIPVKVLKNKGKKSFPRLLIQLIFLLIKKRPNCVHCHLFDASLLGLIASKILGINNRIYTRHNATYNREYHPKMVVWDKRINGMATCIIAISENVKHVLTAFEGVPDSKIKKIVHGFDLEIFSSFSDSSRKAILKKYQIDDSVNSPIVGVISRFLHLKGVQFIIPAFKELLLDYPNAVIVLANANGNFKEQIFDQLKALPESNVRVIKFEEDLGALYAVFDVFVHTPINKRIEAFGQTYVEAMAASVPSVFTLSGIAPEFIVDEFNALVVEYENADQIVKAMKRILSSEDLKQKLISNGKKSIEDFELNRFINSLENLYESIS